MLSKDILSLEFAPERKLAHFLIVLENRPGALGSCSAKLAELGINVLSGFHSVPPKDGTGYWSFFADLTKSRADAKSTADKLRALPVVRDVQFNESRGGILIESLHFPLKWGSGRAIAIRADSMTGMLKRIREIFGDTSAAGIIVHQMGTAAGKLIYEDLCRLMGDEVVKREIHSIVKLYGALGWGMCELAEIDYKKATATIRMKASFECEAFQGKATSPTSNYLRGHLKGWLSEHLGALVNVTETSCIGRGDPVCEFRAERQDVSTNLAA